MRVNDYSYLRAIAETTSGELHMAKDLHQGLGRVSAPAVKNSAEALAAMGKMKLRRFPPGSDPMSKAEELQLMIRHPNNSGLQRDPLTQYFIPAHFVQKLSISQGDRLILAMEGGISISEDPNFRFDFNAHGSGDIKVDAVDTDGKDFRDSWPLGRRRGLDLGRSEAADVGLGLGALEFGRRRLGRSAFANRPAVSPVV